VNVEPSPPRWLDQDEQRAWRAFLESSRLLFEALERQLMSESSMPHGYYEILVHLSESPERTARMGELANRTRSSRSRLSHAIDRLEERGWVERGECATDRRGQYATLTDLGFTAIEAAAPGHVDAVRRHIFDRLTSEQTNQLEQISSTILAGLEPCKRRPALADGCGGDDPAGAEANDSVVMRSDRELLREA
jgi:DNA-binding MarR family transcriptional regulator